MINQWAPVTLPGSCGSDINPRLGVEMTGADLYPIYSYSFHLSRNGAHQPSIICHIHMSDRITHRKFVVESKFLSAISSLVCGRFFKLLT